MKPILLAETILTVRGVTGCKILKLQEFARILFVDDIHNYTRKLEHHEPLKEMPKYDSLDYPKTVGFSVVHLHCGGDQ